MAEFLSAAIHKISTLAESYQPGDADDEIELHNLQPVMELQPQITAMVPEALPTSLYNDYQWNPVQLCAEEFMSLEDIRKQREGLMRCLRRDPDETVEAAEEGPVCLICMEYRATRLCGPCGHIVLCGRCVNEFIQREVYHSVTVGNGEVEDTPIRLPTTCPLCRAIVGQVFKVFSPINH
ncbi:uncharacterized protein LOC128996012 [Macrosteles quadrilineatus]|uniref:uncharacterized protein LOC128996012 n=1 Tax=Macrosteles quadrilineatus TaxID=74068 RepID=UPI0023E1B1DB|nr:uncharacterized protein LOC128996012 [Macrosteles quadrilineatus]